jgi:hypothetical protein
VSRLLVRRWRVGGPVHFYEEKVMSITRVDQQIECHNPRFLPTPSDVLESGRNESLLHAGLDANIDVDDEHEILRSPAVSLAGRF